VFARGRRLWDRAKLFFDATLVLRFRLREAIDGLS
jgi:hypothetical protein